MGRLYKGAKPPPEIINDIRNVSLPKSARNMPKTKADWGIPLARCPPRWDLVQVGAVSS